MNKEQARKNIEEFIVTRGYTYTVESLLDSYLKYYKKGYYVSYTTKECILSMEEELEILIMSENARKIRCQSCCKEKDESEFSYFGKEQEICMECKEKENY